MLIVENFYLSSIYCSGGHVVIPVPYLAYLDSGGKISNLRGDRIEFDGLGTPVITSKPTFNEDYYYDSVRVDVVLDCEDRILDMEQLVFLVGDTLYDIFGNSILKAKIEDDDEEYEQEEEPEEVEVEPEEEEEPGIYDVCNYCFLEFENNLKDYYNNVDFTSDTLFDYSTGLNGKAIKFDGDQYIKSDLSNLTGDWTIAFRFKTSNTTTKYKSLVSFSNNGDNLFNILLQNSEITFFNYSEKKRIAFNANDWNMIGITSSGDVVYNGEIKDNIGRIDLSSGSFPFIIGGDWNEDRTVNNFYDGDLENFRICKRCLNGEEFEELFLKDY